MGDKYPLHIINDDRNIVSPWETFYTSIDVEKWLFQTWIVLVKSLKNEQTEPYDLNRGL